MARRPDNVLQFRGPRNPWPKTPRRPWWKRVSPIMVALPLAAFTAVFLWPTLPTGKAFGLPLGPAALPGSGPGQADREAMSFVLCDELAGGYGRDNCVIDGETFWYRGEKIRIADINTPEVGEPQCAYEAELGAEATGRLRALLNEGAFTLEPIDRDRDQYGRLLRTVTRDGESLGAVLVDEGLAEEWRGYRGSWC